MLDSDRFERFWVAALAAITLLAPALTAQTDIVDPATGNLPNPNPNDGSDGSNDARDDRATFSPRPYPATAQVLRCPL